MVGSRWERRKRNHLWKDDTLKSIKILISMILSIIFIQVFVSLLCSCMYVLIYIHIHSQRGREAEIWSNHLQARGSYTMWPSATRSWQNLHLPKSSTPKKKGSPLQEENSEVGNDVWLSDFPLNFCSFPSCFAHVTLFMLAFRVFYTSPLGKS